MQRHGGVWGAEEAVSLGRWGPGGSGGCVGSVPTGVVAAAAPGPFGMGP